MTSDGARISPTAHYTGFVWYRHGLSHPALRTRQGRMLHLAVRPMALMSRAVGGPSLDGMLLARHRVIDHWLAEAIEAGEVGQVLEVAAGLSARGVRFAERYRERGLRYVEGDLPGMAARKRAALAGAVVRGDHRVVALDACSDASLAAVARRELDPGRGLAIVTEGLLSYLPGPVVHDIWRRFAATLRQFPTGIYLSDLHAAGETLAQPGVRPFAALLAMLVRGRIHLHFDDADAAGRALVAAGFTSAEVHRPRDLTGIPGIPENDGAIRVVRARVS